MKKRELADTVEQQYFDSSSTIPLKEDDGTRDIVPLLPFIISGGSNTERYYFTHISDTTKYKFHIKPEYFGDESNFTEIFPQRIERILENVMQMRKSFVYLIGIQYIRARKSK